MTTGHATFRNQSAALAVLKDVIEYSSREWTYILVPSILLIPAVQLTSEE